MTNTDRDDDLPRDPFAREDRAWRTFLAAAEEDVIGHPRQDVRDSQSHSIRIGRQVRAARRASAWLDFWVVMRETDRAASRVRTSDHVELDIDERMPSLLQIVVTDKDGTHVLSRIACPRLLVAMGCTADEPGPTSE